MMWNWHEGWGPGAWGGWFMLLLTGLFIAALVVAVIYLARALGGGATTRPASGPAESAHDILKRRHAAGEVEREEYLQKLKDL